MKHIVAFPSANISTGLECAAKWDAKGYQVLMMIRKDADTPTGGIPIEYVVEPSPWSGYYGVANLLSHYAFNLMRADLVTFAADDMTPPAQGESHHSALYFKRFYYGEGVMQCTGDRQGVDAKGRAASERICGSPTFGRGWFEKAFGGKGPFGDFGFKSFYCDELLKEVAGKLGLLYQEPALTIDHEHWSWMRRPIAPHNIKAQENWNHDKAIFEALKARGFPHD